MKARPDLLSLCSEVKMANANTVSEINTILLSNIEENIDVIVESKQKEEDWGKDLTALPIFTIKEIEEHRVKSGKNGKSNYENN